MTTSDHMFLPIVWNVDYQIEKSFLERNIWTAHYWQSYTPIYLIISATSWRLANKDAVDSQAIEQHNQQRTARPDSLTQQELLLFRTLAHHVVVPGAANVGLVTFTGHCWKHTNVFTHAAGSHIIVVHGLDRRVTTKHTRCSLLTYCTVNYTKIVGREVHHSWQIPNSWAK